MKNNKMSKIATNESGKRSLAVLHTGVHLIIRFLCRLFDDTLSAETACQMIHE
jgi:hypothetical protein